MLLKKAAAEALGTALLLAAVVGSGIMGEELARPNVALALLANTVATGAALVALIIAFGPISGAHFNPVVTLADASQGGLPWREVPVYLAAQVAGAFLGVAVAHVMFKQPALFFASQHRRDGIAQLVSEFVATFGLLGTIFGVSRFRPDFTAAAVGLYITAAYWFTASTSFANPAVAIARALTNTFSGIRPIDLPGFIIAQLIGAACALALTTWLLRPPASPFAPQSGYLIHTSQGRTQNQRLS
jgi:glycerol uptake facilitator-like aquaporin